MKFFHRNQKLIKVGSFGIMNNPEYRQEPWQENIRSRLDFFDVVCMVCGNKGDLDLLAKNFPAEWKSGKLKAVYKPWPFPEWSYEELPKHLNLALELVRQQGCNWGVKLDIDTVFHEKDYKKFRDIINKAQNRKKLLVSFEKLQFFKPVYCWVKSNIPVAVNLSAPISYGFDKEHYNDLCQPILWNTSSKFLLNGKKYDIPSGHTVSKNKILKIRKLYLYNYDYTFRTYERSVELLYQIEMAHARFWGKGYSGLTIDKINKETAINDFLQTSNERYCHMKKKMKIKNHPKYFQNSLINLIPAQWGYNLWIGRSLGLFLTKGISLSTWDRIGSIEREIKPYIELSKIFNKVYIFSYGINEAKKYLKLFPENIEIVSKPRFIPIIIYSFLLPLICCRKLKKIQIIKTNQMVGSWTAVIAKKLCKNKLVVRCGYEWLKYLEKTKASWFKRKIAYCIENFAYKNANKIIITSDEGKDFIKGKFLIPEDKIILNPNYVDTDKFKPLDLKKESGTIIFVGRLDPVKNLENLIKGMKGLNASLVIIGEGPLKTPNYSLMVPPQ